MTTSLAHEITLIYCLIAVVYCYITNVLRNVSDTVYLCISIKPWCLQGGDGCDSRPSQPLWVGHHPIRWCRPWIVQWFKLLQRSNVTSNCLIGHNSCPCLQKENEKQSWSLCFLVRCKETCVHRDQASISRSTSNILFFPSTCHHDPETGAANSSSDTISNCDG